MTDASMCVKEEYIYIICTFACYVYIHMYVGVHCYISTVRAHEAHT